MPRLGPREWSPRGEIPGAPIWPRFVDSYLDTALWSSHGENTEFLDGEYDIDDFSQKSIDQVVEESNDFILANRKDLEAVGDEAQHGHDFWMTRNNAGGGFWDRGYGAIGKRLTEAAEVYKEAHPYVGDDGKLYFE